jgi:hypothetical protein
MKTNLKEVIESEVSEVFELERLMNGVESELRSNPEFVKFLELQQAVQKKNAEIRSRIEEVAVPAYLAGELPKTVKFDFGSITMVDNFPMVIDEKKLCDKYWTRVPDKKYILQRYHLENKTPQGVSITRKVALRMDLKKVSE